MKKLILGSLLGLALVAFTGCTDASDAKVGAQDAKDAAVSKAKDAASNKAKEVAGEAIGKAMPKGKCAAGKCAAGKCAGGK